jgi:hypothetical protein
MACFYLVMDTEQTITILSCILVMLLPRRNGYRTNHKQSCPASLSCYFLVMDTEQTINNQDCWWFVLYPLRGNNMTRMQDKIVYDLFCIHYAEVIIWQGCRTRLFMICSVWTNHKQSCPASLSCYYLGVMDTEQIINNLVLHPCHVSPAHITTKAVNCIKVYHT